MDTGDGEEFLLCGGDDDAEEGCEGGLAFGPKGGDFCKGSELKF